MWPFGGRFFPGTNLQDLNLDWIVQRVRDLSQGIIAPFINDANFHWMVWDTDAETFVDSGVCAAGEGPQGPQGPQGPTGPTGDAGLQTNLLINGCFLPGYVVNQRGQTDYSGQGFAFDRWRLWGNSPSSLHAILGADGLTLNNSAASAINWIEQPVTLPAGVYTFSALAGAITGNAALLLLDSSRNVVSGSTALLVANGVTKTTVTFSADFTGYVAIRAGSGAVANIKAAALEAGNNSTLAAQDTNNVWYLRSLPVFSMELQKCQRYFYRFHLCGNTPFPIAAGYATASGNAVRAVLDLPAAMVTTPQISTSAVLRIFGNDLSAAVTIDALTTSEGYTNDRPNTNHVYVNAAGTFTGGHTYTLVANGSSAANSYIDFSCEEA